MTHAEYHEMDQNYFHHLMDRFGPFETSPHIAVGVSGGADSLALAFLLFEWTKNQAGRLTALIVDHGLRFESGIEAQNVAQTLRAKGIEAVILKWNSKSVSSGIQAKARNARYQLMEDWCRDAGVLHLAIAHHADDQAETVLMRMQKGSGPDGLAGIPHSRELTHCRIIRPLLNVRKKTLLSFLNIQGASWVEDPSNQDRKYARTSVRESIKFNKLDVEGITRSAARYARVREAAEMNVAAWLARHSSLQPSGFITLCSDDLFDAPVDTRLRILSRIATVIGGKTYAPTITSIETLDEKLRAMISATVSGALFRQKNNTLTVCREVRNLPKPVLMIEPSILWDGRFRVAVDSRNQPVEVLAFCHIEGRRNDDFDPPDWFSDLPLSVKRTYPVIRVHNKILIEPPNKSKKSSVSIEFQPKIPLVGMGFSVA